jgi:hypothetical protein
MPHTESTEALHLESSPSAGAGGASATTSRKPRVYKNPKRKKRSIFLRPDELAAFTAAAQRCGMSLAKWMRQACVQVANEGLRGREAVPPRQLELRAPAQMTLSARTRKAKAGDV